MLGCGTPIADPARSGPSLAILVNDSSYIVDFGPGVVRRASAAYAKGYLALGMEKLNRVFVTHLHSDHTAGFPDLILTPWVLGRSDPIEVYGPAGIKAMSENILKAYQEDIQVRLHGNQPATANGYKVIAHEIGPGVVYRDKNVKVTAFAVKHGAWKKAFGYKFETADRSIVISGDTTPLQVIVEQCNGCDLLIHEVYSKAGFDRRAKNWQEYHAVSHTSGIELGRIAAKAKPRHLVLYHQLLWGSSVEDLLGEVRQNFKGKVSYANDLDVF
ncbi:MAG: MBL fold metallo-hydrolase [Deltaproteobacteria bacterium]|nr:MBL fold metallo-hydrolase [Deltaproteobacteria bacterium]MBW1872626.1 MBL fold metallo-hydrolase [Deltaproteobacteria bacterium]